MLVVVKYLVCIIDARRTVQASITKPIDHDTNISLLRDNVQSNRDELNCSSGTKNLVSSINVHKSGTKSNIVFKNKSKPVDVPRS